MATRPFSNHDGWLTNDTLQLLDTIHDFQYSTLNPAYNCLDDLHANIDVELVRNIPAKTRVITVSLGDVRSTLEKLNNEHEEIQRFNNAIGEKIRRTQNWELERQMKRFEGYYLMQKLQDIVDRHTNDPDTTPIDITSSVHRLGYYTRRNGRGLIVLEHTNDDQLLVITYLHEMMHAFYDADLSKPMNDAEYAEEPLAEYGMLHFLQEFVRAHTQYANLLTYALAQVRQNQQTLSLAHYGFGAYLYEHFQHIEWEHLMRDAHSRINNTIAPYTDLKDALNGVYPSATQLPRVAQLLHDVLTDANGMGGVPIVAQAPIGGMMVGGGRIRLYSFRVAGISYPDSNGICRAHNIRSLNIGDTLTVQEDFSNPYDSEAILLIRPDGRELGFIPNDELKTIPVNIIEDGNEAHLCAIITDIQSEGAYSDRFVEVDLVIV